MFRIPFLKKCRPVWLAFACSALSPAKAAEEPPLREILRDALFAEEVSRDPAAAAKQYERLLARYAEQREFAASALFRLAEVRRKQDRKEDAIQLYQRLLAEFPTAENVTKLARENLAALGGKVLESEAMGADPESKELARLQGLSKTSPDLLRDSATLDSAVRLGFQKAVAFLLSAGADPFGGVALKLAASSGNLAIVRQLLATGAPVPETVGQAAVSEAVRSDRGAVLAFFLEKGVRPDSRTFCDVVYNGKYAMAGLLLKHGADPDAMLPPLNGSRPLTILSYMIDQDNFDGAKWLLDQGAKPDVSDEFTGLTPAHHAAKSTGRGSVEILERLLKAGADANRVSESKSEKTKNISYLAGATPLDAAFQSGYEVAAKARVLLSHGANPNITGMGIAPLETAVKFGDFALAKLFIEAGADRKKPGLLAPFLGSDDEGNVAKLRFLLENGVDPNVPVGIVNRDQTEGSVDSFLEVTGEIEEYPYLPINRVHFPGGSKDAENYQKQVAVSLEVTRLMLEAGAKVGPFLGEFLYQVAMVDEKGDVFAKLIEQLPNKLPVTTFPDMSGWKPVPRQMYLEQALIPALQESPNITLVDRDTGRRTTLADGGDGKTLPTTLELLREKKELLIGTANQRRRWPELSLARRGEEIAVPFDLDGDAALPDLRAGDVLAVKWSDPIRNRSDAGNWIVHRYDWAIEKRISFPISLEIDGNQREILLRGDLLSFDPTKAEAPRVDAASLIALFLADSVVRKDSLLVKREGWKDIRLGNAEGFQLQKGDRLVFESEPKPALEGEFERVTLVSPGLPFSQMTTVQGGTGIDAAPFVPTLVQIITDAYAPKPSWEEIPRENAELFPSVAAKEKFFNEVPVVLPHPDFSAIRIRRTDGEGKLTILEVDWTEAIRSCTDATTPMQARAADVFLKDGDVVELPTVAARKSEVWNGFTPDETRYFHKALAGRVLINGGGGNIEQREINYRPPEWRVSAHGTLPLPPVEGIATTRLKAVVSWSGASIQRDGAKAINAVPGTFIRDGDQIDRRPGDLQGRQPRPRVVPPPVPQQ